MIWAIVIGGALALVAIIMLLARGWVGTASKGGQDKEARKQLEEMAKREKKREKIKARPGPRFLRAQLEWMRDRLRRNRM